MRRSEMASGELLSFDKLPASICSMLEAHSYGAQYWAQPPAQPKFESPLAAAAAITSSQGAYASNASMASLKDKHSLPHTPRKRERGRETLDDFALEVLKRPKLAKETDGQYWGAALTRASDLQRQAFDITYGALGPKQGLVDGGAPLALAPPTPSPHTAPLSLHPPRPAPHAHAHTLRHVKASPGHHSLRWLIEPD